MKTTPRALVQTSTRAFSFEEYDHIIVMFSGGKDSLACLLALMDLNAPMHKVEIWHQLVDGWSDNNSEAFMDWECTEGYCQAIAEWAALPIYLQYREGGFLREASRHNQATAPIIFQDHNWEWIKTGGKGKPNTREKFPQVSADLSVRWCSSSLKIETASAAIRNQPRFNNASTLVITGERREESAARAKYMDFESHRSHSVGPRSNRYVDHWRPVIDWTEGQVWAIIESFGLVAHPAYYLGWSRCSCKTCIFLNADGFASVKKISPDQFEFLAELEDMWGVTMKRQENLRTLAERGVPYKALNDPDLEPFRLQATERTWMLPITTKNWFTPAGAYGDTTCGPS